MPRKLARIKKIVLNNHGSIFVTVFLSLMVIVGIGFVYFYYTKLSELGPPPLPITRSIPTPLPETVNWKPYEETKKGISMKIPLNWYVSEDNVYISQFPFDVKESGSQDIYNDFYIASTSVQLESGYTNSDWLSRINNLGPNDTLNNEFRPATTLSIKKVSEGQTSEGIHFVVFKNVATDEGVIGAFIKNDVVYELILRQYNQEGIDTMQKVMTTITIDAPQSSP